MLLLLRSTVTPPPVISIPGTPPSMDLALDRAPALGDLGLDASPAATRLLLNRSPELPAALDPAPVFQATLDAFLEIILPLDSTPALDVELTRSPDLGTLEVME